MSKGEIKLSCGRNAGYSGICCSDGFANYFQNGEWIVGQCNHYSYELQATHGKAYYFFGNPVTFSKIKSDS